MTENKGKVVSINGNLVSVRFEGAVSMNEIRSEVDFAVRHKFDPEVRDPALPITYHR